VDADADSAVDALGGPDQLEAEAEVAGVGHVVGGEVLDALVDHLVEVHRGREREPGEDRHLGGGVLAGDVVGGIGLGVAELLGAPEGLRVGDPPVGHLGEDEVGGAVDDPVDALDVRRGERLLQHADHRHHAGHGALEAQLHAALARRRPQLLAVLGQQQLVGRHHVAPGAHRPQHVVARGVDAAHQLHDQVGALEDVVEVAARARQHPGDLGAQPGDRLDVGGPLRQQPRERGADGAVAEEADAEGLRRPGHAGPPRSRGARPRGRCRPRTGSPAAGGRRCSCWPARARTRP